MQTPATPYGTETDQRYGWTRAKLEQLRKHHFNAVESKCDTFIYDSMVFDTQYAKYLIEFLDGKLK